MENMMDNQIFNKFTKHLKNTLRIAGFLAKRENKKKVEPIHLLQGILHQQGSLAAEILHKNGIRLASPLSVSQEDIKPNTITLELNEHSQRIFTKMINIAFEYQHLYIGTEHLLMALLSLPDEKIAEFIKNYKKSIAPIRHHLEAILNSTSHFSDIANIFSDLLGDRQQPDRPLAPPVRDSKSLLELFTTDLTSDDIQKNIDPVIGREKEIERLVQILSRRHKNNPLLIGEPGVGKTAIVEGLAKKIISGDVPEVLKGKRILSLDLGLLVAGTMYRGEFEARLKNILDEIKANPNIIIFIDEIHNIIGAGSTTGGTMDAANLIKPALARGEIRCIGATTQTEFRKYIETDAALERRFQTIYVEEASPVETAAILQGLKKYYEDFHQVAISEDALQSAIDLSVRFIPEKYLPDKAIDIIDEAASRVKIRRKPSALQKAISASKEKLAKLEQQKDRAILAEDYDQALRLKEQASRLQSEISRLLKQTAKQPEKMSPVTAKDVAEVVAQTTNIPLAYLTASSDKLVRQLDKKIRQRIVGQEEAIKELSAVIKRAQLGIAEHKKPIGSFLFLGPSGVGKTELARVLAQEYFGRQDALIKIDMSEYAESFNISKLIGAPAGYVGYKESGKLTQSVRRRPYSVVLFDEIEKGHPDVANLLLQILDEGYLTDAEGRKVDFKNTIVIITSNIASDKFNEQADLGFGSGKKDKQISFDKVKQQVMAELEENFKPELLNRLDKIIVFNPLSAQDLKKIVKLNLDELAGRLKQKNINITYSPAVVSYLARLSYDPGKGAREVRRAIQDKIEHPLAEMILKSPSLSSFQIDYKKKLQIRPVW